MEFSKKFRTSELQALSQRHQDRPAGQSVQAAPEGALGFLLAARPGAPDAGRQTPLSFLSTTALAFVTTRHLNASTESELTRLKAEYDRRRFKAVIRKETPGKGSNYALRYFTRETDNVYLF